MTQQMEREGGPPRHALPHMEGTIQTSDRDADRTRPHCRAVTYDDEGIRVPCRWWGVVTWFGIPFCPRHAPARRPGMPGWDRLA